MTVHLEVTADGVGTLRLDRPPLNALDIALQDRLRALAGEIAGREDVRAVVLWGGEKVFAAGADIKEMRAMDHEAMIARGRGLQDAFTAVARIPQPVVAAVTGYALGGGLELALCADVRFAAANARLGQPEILLGLIPGAGGTQRLPRLVGPSRAKDLIFTGRQVTAEEALTIGLVDRVLPAEEVHEAAHAWAARLAAGPAIALRAAKEAVDGGLDAGIDTGLAIERTWFAGLFATADREYGMRSFVEDGPGKADFRTRS
ncbi:enoyl-CoA hydratase-related protein [Streptomyces sp. DSM 44917]|uniref:Enoyl-CoA hydratase-related protein n=1 Tax=Streptomyces boetiae TaxID=3075541 RepID=A0ABU2L5S8_9ACTN|nr:enoyl-CoA hydratase-related protein [Streptomyces sp. DSM 44917]MDT0306917.1 enoyl-CoA hydratase-related protein [Streptomyces sp. DSM 44917]